MQNNALISVIIPAFNSAKYLARTIDSIKNQTYKNIEIIIVDDCSTDNSFEIAKGYAAKNIFAFKLQHNSGQCAASNFGVQKSSGNFIKLFDADDLLNKQHLEIQYLAIKDNPDYIASGQLSRFFNNNVSNALHEPVENWRDLTPIDWLLINNGKGLGMMQCGMFLFPREILDKSGLWDERLSLINDFEFFPRVLLLASKIRFCENAIVYYRSGMNNSLSNILSNKALTSAHLALTLTTKKILSVENSARSKNVMANYWALWAYHFYPTAPDLFRNAEAMVLKLSGNKYKPNLSGSTKIVSSILGWKLTKRLKMFVNRP